jgi:hypothetical protein
MTVSGAPASRTSRPTSSAVWLHDLRVPQRTAGQRHFVNATLCRGNPPQMKYLAGTRYLPQKEDAPWFEKPSNVPHVSDRAIPLISAKVATWFEDLEVPEDCPAFSCLLG